MTAKEIQIYNNYVTPLAGTFLNLPETPCRLRCPSCGVTDMSKVEMEMHRTSWHKIIGSRILHGLCCCCCEMDCREHFYNPLPNHYCKNCGCYFGQQKEVSKLSLEVK